MLIFIHSKQKVGSNENQITFHKPSLFDDHNKNFISYDSLNLTKNFDVFQYLPHDFIITTKNGSCTFNSEMLRASSNVIFQHIQNNNKFIYNLDIDDNVDVLSKFTELYQGKTVYFDEEELPICQQITQLLNIIYCPEYMKPKELRGQNLKNYIIDDFSELGEGVRLSYFSFSQFLSNSLFKSFTIATKKNKYKCTPCGSCSSIIIRQLLLKNPDLDHYFFDFDDEFNEFQPICDLFNFQKVNLTASNMNSIKQIANLLQIDIIIDAVDKYIQKYGELYNTICEHQNLIDEIDHLFDLLYNIKEYSIEKVKNEIINSFWSKGEDNVKELAAFIINAINLDLHIHSYLIDLLIELNSSSNSSNNLNILLNCVKKRLIQLFGNTLENCSFICQLNKRGIISKEEIINRLRIIFKINIEEKHHIYSINNVFVWFLPEIMEINLYNQFIHLIEKKIH